MNFSLWFTSENILLLYQWKIIKDLGSPAWFAALHCQWWQIQEFSLWKWLLENILLSANLKMVAVDLGLVKYIQCIFYTQSSMMLCTLSLLLLMMTLYEDKLTLTSCFQLRWRLSNYQVATLPRMTDMEGRVILNFVALRILRFGGHYKLSLFFFSVFFECVSIEKLPCKIQIFSFLYGN